MTVTDNGHRKLTIQRVNISGAGFSFVGPTLPLVLSPQQQAQLSFSFTPQTTGPVSGTATIVYWVAATSTSSGYSGRATASLSGTGVSGGYLSVPSSMNLGSVLVGSSHTHRLTLSNTGGASLTISSANISGSSFSVSGLTLPYYLAAGATANMYVTFSPTSSGTKTASLIIGSTASNPSVTVSLSGTGTLPAGTLAVAPASMDFGSIAVGSSKAQALILSNTGGSSLTISSAAITGSAFTATGLSFPYTLAAGASASLSVTYSPTSAATNTASLVLASDASNPSVSVSLSGIATAPSGTIAVTPGSVDFGSIAVGSNKTQGLTLSNTGGASLTISSATITGEGFTINGLNFPYSLAAGTSANLSVTYAPTGAGTNSGSLAIASNGSNPSVTVSLTGTAAIGTLTVPASIDFSSVAVGSSKTQTLTLSNTGGSSLTISSATITGSGFSMSGLSFPYSLAAGASANLSVTYAPTSAGTNNGSLALASNGSNPSVTVSLTGTATIGTLSVAPASMDFGSITVGSSKTQALTLSNTGGASLMISAATISGNGFTVSGLSFPYSLAAGASATLSVTYAPTSAGSNNASLAIASNGSNPSVTVPLTGTATVGTLSVATSSMDFGSIGVGGTRTQSLSFSNTGTSSLTISSATITGAGFSVSGLSFPYSLAAGASANLSVTYAPTIAGTNTASLVIASNASNPSVAVSLTGTATIGTLSVAPSSMNFGSLTVGSTKTQALSLSNTGGSGLTISAATITGSSFTVSGLTFPYSLAAGSSVNLSVTYAPTSAGTNTASLIIASNASNPSVTVSLSGSAAAATGTLGVTPASLAFGSVTIGATQTQSGSVTANGGSVTVSSTSSSNSVFTIGGLTLPLTLAAGQSAPFTVTFAPTAAGATSATLSFFGSNSTSASETATGTGATIQHRVDLSWNASTSTSVTGYNVYRGTSATGPYSRINSVLNPSMYYSDSTVKSGQTYYYITTAVDSSGAESGYSNQAQAIVPMP